jgi:hypothetical protein
MDTRYPIIKQIDIQSSIQIKKKTISTNAKAVVLNQVLNGVGAHLVIKRKKE